MKEKHTTESVSADSVFAKAESVPGLNDDRDEHRHDMLLSALKASLEAVGAETTINVRVGGRGREHFLSFDVRELV